MTKPNPNIFDNSMETDFQKCSRYYQLRHEMGLTLPNALPSFKMEFGTAFHLGRELVDKGESLSESIIKSVESYLPFEPESTISVAGNEIEPLHSSNRLATILAEYADEYKDDPVKVWEGQVELGLAEELTGGIFHCGRIDKMVSVGGKIRPADYKTTKALSSFVYNPHNQLTGYQWLCQKLFGEQNIGGVMFDMIGLAKSKRAYRREFVTYTKFQVQEWIDSTLWKIDKIFSCREKGFWPKETKVCNDYFSDCQFIPVCTAPNETGYEQIIAGYETSYWFPYNVKED